MNVRVAVVFNLPGLWSLPGLWPRRDASPAARVLSTGAAVTVKACSLLARQRLKNHEEPCPPTAIRGQCRTPPRAQQDEAPLALWNGVDCSSLLMSRSRRIPRRSCRTIPRGDKLDGLLGTKTCLCCTTAPATVRWESLLATQGLTPARVNCARPPRRRCGGVGTSCGVYQCETAR